MCHLFAISSSAPRTFGPFFEPLAPYSETESPDGWGVAAAAAGRTTLIREPRAFAVALREGNGAVARAARTRGDVLLFHIREASVGAHTLENTHPFRRRALGRTFLFAHNGTVPRVKERALRRLVPAGDTDSEHAFLAILESMPAVTGPAFARWLKAAADDIRATGKFNFVMTDGKTLWAYADTSLHWCERADADDGRPSTGPRARPKRARAPSASRTSRSVLVATCPFTGGDPWTPLEPGNLLVARSGRVQAILR